MYVVDEKSVQNFEWKTVRKGTTQDIYRIGWRIVLKWILSRV